MRINLLVWKEIKGGFFVFFEINVVFLVCFVDMELRGREDVNYRNICFCLLNEKRWMLCYKDKFDGFEF